MGLAKLVFITSDHLCLNKGHSWVAWGQEVEIGLGLEDRMVKTSIIRQHRESQKVALPNSPHSSGMDDQAGIDDVIQLSLGTTNQVHLEPVSPFRAGIQQSAQSKLVKASIFHHKIYN